MAIKLKHITLYVLLWVLTTASAFYVGTYFPNKKTIRNIEDKITVDIQNDFARHKLFEPEMIYNDNVSFAHAVNECINFANLTTPIEKRIDRDIIIAMAIIESAYGTSRFAIKGNNLFGIRTWDKNVAQMKPKENPNAEWGVKTYITKCKSVIDMISILNRLQVYEEFRKERERQRESEMYNIDLMINHLSAWSTNPAYTALVKQKAKESYQIFSSN